EIHDLYRDILISVTQFFRDPQMFEALARICAGRLDKREGNGPFRIWCAGCASGEEAYSLVIAIMEVLEETGRSIPVQLFSTDISETAIERARTGVYPELIEQEISADRLNRFFTRVESGYRVTKTLRESCVFARHDVVRDPPFSQLDLVSSRNVMIYLGSAAQRRVLSALHYGLKPQGLLVLGSAESIGNHTDLFDVVDNDHKLFSKKVSPHRFSMTLPDPKSFEAVGDKKPIEVSIAPNLLQIEGRSNRVLRDLYSPPGVTINDSMQIMHFHGQTSLYLEPPSGEASLNLLRVAHRDLVFPLRKAIDTAADRKEEVYESGIRFERGGEQRDVALRVIPMFEGEARYYLILFEDGRARQTAAPRPGDGEASLAGLELVRVQSELDNTRDYLRRMVEQHEVAIEELRAAHEEVQSSNEEMQSTNEELRTAKEELQSSNEELGTVNDELRNRNRELDAANNDLVNVLNAASIPMIMVGMDQRIRRFTPAADRMLKMNASDLGRLVTDVTYSVTVPGFKEMISATINTLAVQETKIQDRQGKWYSVVVRPYRTLENRIDGAVISFLDVDDVTQALNAAEAARDFAEGIVETVQHPLLVLDSELRVKRATAAFYKTFRVTPEETLDQPLPSLGDGSWNDPKLLEMLEEIASGYKTFRDFDVEREFPGLGRRCMRLNAKRISGPDQANRRILLSIDDVTERKEAAEIEYRRLFESAKDGILVIDGSSGQVTDVNPYFLELTRYRRTDLVGKAFWSIQPFQKSEEGRRLVAETMEREITRFDSVHLQAADGRRLIVEIIANRYRVKEHTLIQANIRDVTQRRQVEEDLHRSNLDLQQFAFAASHDLQEPLRTVINQVQFLEKRYGGRLDAGADEIIQFITSATDRMRHMVLDLLNFAQTARSNLTIAQTSVEAILSIVMSNLQLAIETTGAQISFDPLPTVWTDQSQFVQLFQNLIGNALKYRGAEPPRIHLAARQVGEEWIFSVTDNGLGFDSKFREHIFTVFKRLHGPEYPGTGIGLATCKRIVERHGGRIWAESEPGKGSTFFFTVQIPKGSA
ncbi:MAG: CheR family methyltransferase, partial [Bryobacteraceae bacterium]